MSADSPRHARSGGPLTVPSQPPSDRSIIDTVSGLINDITLSSSSTVDPKDVIQWARFETADINEPTPEGDSDNDISPLLLILGYGAGVQVWLIPPAGEAQEVLSWRQGTVRVLRILPTPHRNDCFASKRPLIALCDSAGPGPSFCSISFISIRGGEQVKSIKFKNPILDVLANKRSVVISFSERFAVFDAGTLEDRMTVTTCYPCPCPLGGNNYTNPLALGDRWLAYADKKYHQSKGSAGGCEGDGVTSYTATVLHAAKSLSKGLRGLGESVAHSLAGGRPASQSPSPPHSDVQQPGVVTILDIEGFDEEDGQDNEEPYDPLIAHFMAHSEAIIALKFDHSGVLLVTADRRGHDFHVFRINPHPCGSHLASVHHLYILHRGDTTAKVQDIAISCDSRWAAVSTLRGTTHVFAVSAYGGACGVRTHTQPRVVNRLSRFRRSAGLPVPAGNNARSASPVGDGIGQGAWFPNPRLPPYPVPTTATPLAQLRPTHHLPTHTITRTSSGRQRLSSLSEDSNVAPLLARARFGPAAPPAPGAISAAPAAPALYLMAANGCLLHLALHPRPARNIAKEKISDESPIEVDVEEVAQWRLQRPPAAGDLLAPLPPTNPLLAPLTCRRCVDVCLSEEERWLSQVEIVTHAGPHRRLWMGPQFVFKTYNCTGSNSSLSEAETVEVETSASRGAGVGVARSNPVNMPGARPLVPVIVDSGSASSLEHSPSDSFRRKSLLTENSRATSVCDVQLKEDLAEAMKEDHGWKESRATTEVRREVAVSATIERVVDPLGTVVIPLAATNPSPDQPDDPDFYTTSNADEATFRPVVRAPATLTLHPDIIVRPLPRETTIPVQTITPLTNISPQEEPMPLNTGVVIPAALSADLHTETYDNGFENQYVTDKLARESSRKLAELYNVQKVIKDETIKQDVKMLVSDNLENKSINAVNKDLKSQGDVCKYDSMCEKSLVVTERESEDKKSLPKSNGPSDDIQPTPKTRSKKSPTPKSLSDVRIKNKMNEINEGELINKTLNTKLPEKSEVNISVSPKHKVGAKENIEAGKTKSAKEISIVKEPKPSKSHGKYLEPYIEAKESKETKAAEVIDSKLVKDDNIPKLELESKGVQHHENKKQLYNKQQFEKSAEPPVMNLDENTTFEEIRTEDQAWDMLLTEREVYPVAKSRSLSKTKVIENSPDDKSKPKRSRKKDDFSFKTEQDNFVEIHTIEEKPQTFSSDLISVSTTYEEIEPTYSYASRLKASRSHKSVTPQKDYIEQKPSENSLYLEPEILCSFSKSRHTGKVPEDIEVIPEPIEVTAINESGNRDSHNTINKDDNLKECRSLSSNILPKSKKTKSLSPYAESRKLEKTSEIDRKDLVVINTNDEDFPDIQITRRNKLRKKSPQPPEKRNEEPVIEKPQVSWSSIAASNSKSLKNSEEDKTEKVGESKFEMRKTERERDLSVSSNEISLQEKLIELCKRTDIMVAVCDAPSELNFVDEHHTILKDLPPLEPLDFGLDDFRLEVMRDSLLEVNSPPSLNLSSPICKINIDDILSSIKETTSKAIESSMFNLVDLERVPAKKERGFSVIEDNKITTHEVRIDDLNIDDKGQATVQFSRRDLSRMLSIDSDDECKKSTDVSKITPQSANMFDKGKNLNKSDKIFEKSSDEDPSSVFSSDNHKEDEKFTELQTMMLPSIRKPSSNESAKITEKSSDEEPSLSSIDKDDKKTAGLSKVTLPSTLKKSNKTKNSRRKNK